MNSMDSPYNNDTASLQSSGCEELDHHHLDSSSFFPSPDNYSKIQPNLMFPNTDTTTTTARPAATSSRTSKKRSRASRRAPTTVLTTDTSNFRAMVQEFTGIPSPPFNSTAPSSFSSPFHPSMSRFFNMEPSALGVNQQNFVAMQNLGVQLRNDVAPGGGGGGGGGYGGMDVGLMGLAGSGWALDGPGGFQPQYGLSDSQRK